MNYYKSIMTAIILVMIGTSQLNAQTLKEKMAAKLEAAKAKLNESGGSASTSEIDIPTESQVEIAAKWESGKYTYYDVDGRSMRKQEPQHIRILKDENGKITHMRRGEAGGYEMESGKYNVYSYGGSEFVCAFVQNNNNCIYITDEMIVFYGCNSKYKVSEIYGTLKGKKSPVELMKEIQAYRDYGEAKVDGDRDKIKEDEIANRAIYSLEGKEVIKITPIYPDGKPSFIGANDAVEVGFELTLSDGTVMKTSNVGGEAYVEDLIDETTNASISGVGSSYMTGQYGANPKTSASIRVNVTDFSKDYVLVTVKPKYGGNATCEIKLPIEYSTQEVYMCSGGSGRENRNYGGRGGDGGDGGDVTVKIKTTTHSETGETLYLCEATGCLKQLYKLKIGGTFHVSASGGMGGQGGPGRNVNANGGYAAPTDGGPAGDGGNGGNVTFLIDPSAKGVNATYTVNGGNGGVGGTNGTCFSCSYGQDAEHGSWGSGGAAGQGTITTQTVNF